jgi:hypothetical protein
LDATYLDPGVQRFAALVVHDHASLLLTLAAYSQGSGGTIVIVEVKGD